MSNTSQTFVVTGKVRLSYVHLTKPYVNQPGSEPKYSATILLPKSDIHTKQLMDAAIQAAIQEGVAGCYKGVRPPILALPIHDGDGARPSDGTPFNEECHGHWVMTASTKTQPQVVDMALSPILNQSEIYSGMYARVSLRFFPYENSGKKGVGVALNNVQKVEDGEPLGGRTSAADDFGTPAGYAPQQPYPQQPQYQAPIAPPYTPPAMPQYQPPVAPPQYQPQAAPQYPQQPTYAPPAQPAQPEQPAQQYPQQPQIDPITGQPIIPGGVMGIGQ